jgi:hypothetical protein
MIKGTYVFYDGDKEICRSKNIITQFGKRFIANFLAGNVNFNNKDIAIGVGGQNISGGTTPTNQSTRLDFEFYRLPVEFGSIDIQQSGTDGLGNPIYSYTVIYTTTIPQDISGRISEIGLYPNTRASKNDFDSKFITYFDNQLDWSPNPVILTSDYSRVGNTVLTMKSNGTSNREYKTSTSTIDMSGYSINDTLSLSYYKADSNLEAITVRFYSSDTAYYYATFSPTAGTGNKIHSINLSAMLSDPIGSPDLSQINAIGIIINPLSAESTVYMDALRINDEDTFDPNFGLISRSVLSSELVKLAGRQVKVQYRLDLSF